MTIDESEIRRRFCNALLTSGHNCKFSPYHPAIHSALCDEMTAMCVTALAAERDQHARDVADAWRNAAREITCSPGCNFHVGMVRDHAHWCTRGIFEARAQALNDSRNGEAADVKDAGVRATALPPPPPSGINQGSGAGEACGNNDAGGWPCDMRRGHGGGVHRDVNGGVWPANGFLSAPPPSPASPAVPYGHCNRCRRCGWEIAEESDYGCWLSNCSMRPMPPLRDTCAGCGAPYAPTSPTGETRDERPLRPRAEREAATYCYCWTKEHPDPCEDSEAGRRCRLAPPASAPGGAPGVETCETCKGEGTVDGIDYVPLVAGGYRELCRGKRRCQICKGTGTTPTPGTETPTAKGDQQP